jgi:hypothetical protein
MEHEFPPRSPSQPCCPRSSSARPADISTLYAEIRATQARLGTPTEAPGDFERILHLAHQLNNLLAAELLRARVG